MRTPEAICLARFIMCCLIPLPIVGGTPSAAADQGGPADNPPGGLVWARASVPGLPVEMSMGTVSMPNPETAWVGGGVLPAGAGFDPRAYKLKWLSGQWKAVYSHSFRSNVNAIAAVAEDDVWVAGSAGMLVHKDGQEWHEVEHEFSGLTGATFTSLQMMDGGTEGWAGGVYSADDTTGCRSRTGSRCSGSFLLHFTDGRWVTALAGYSGDMYELARFAPDEQAALSEGRMPAGAV